MKTLEDWKAAESAAVRILRDLAEVEAVVPALGGSIRLQAEHARRISLSAVGALEAARD